MKPFHTFDPSWIRFEDTHLLVLSKPAGLLSQGDQSGEPSLVDLLRVYVGRNYVGLVHRLDRQTSGLMVVGKRSKAADRLSEALRTGALKRRYQALVLGKLGGDLKKGRPRPIVWNHTIEVDHPDDLKKTGKKVSAQLEVTPLKHVVRNGIELTLAEFELETGRKHQIRIQAALEGHPLLGDTKHGGATLSTHAIKKIWPHDRLALHSRSLEFPHPMSGEILQFEEPLPSELIQCMADSAKRPS